MDWQAFCHIVRRVTDKGACVQLLKKFDGDVDRVINEVLIHMDSPQTLNLLVNPEKRSLFAAVKLLQGLVLNHKTEGCCGC